MAVTHEYQISGMTCQNCASKIQDALNTSPKVSNARVSKSTDTAIIESNADIDTSELQEILSDLNPKYGISMSSSQPIISSQQPDLQQKSWLATYRPILIIFAYLIGITLTIQFLDGDFNMMEWMRHFMGGFFLAFSFFKMMDLKGFAESYQMYDVIAKQWSSWGYIYAFVELGLGIAFLLDNYHLQISIITLVIMCISTIGVLQSVLQKRRIQCACLGAIFDLPMSTVTIIENGLMIAMSAFMIYYNL